MVHGNFNTNREGKSCITKDINKIVLKMKVFVPGNITTKPIEENIFSFKIKVQHQYFLCMT